MQHYCQYLIALQYPFPSDLYIGLFRLKFSASMKNENKNKTENVKGRMAYSNQRLICEIDKAVASFHWEHTDIMLVPRVHYFIIDA